MSRTRVEVPQLENMVVTGKKKFVRYAEGAQLYSLGLHTFQEIAKEANAVYKVKRCVLVLFQLWFSEKYKRIVCKWGWGRYLLRSCPFFSDSTSGEEHSF